VKIYNPLIPTNYAVAAVTGITNTSVMTLDTVISNSTILGVPNLNVDVISDPYQAFTNPQNQNVVRYYNTSLTAVDGYDTLQIKLVLLSNNSSVTPRVASLTAIGVSS
jgi:hypothetical protein